MLYSSVPIMYIIFSIIFFYNLFKYVIILIPDNGVSITDLFSAYCAIIITLQNYRNVFFLCKYIYISMYQLVCCIIV